MSIAKASSISLPMSVSIMTLSGAAGSAFSPQPTIASARDKPKKNLDFFIIRHQLFPAITIKARPTMKKTNMVPSRRLTFLPAPLNSFQTKTPQIAAIIGAPWPRA